MYHLSIDHQGRAITTTDHPDRDDAHRSLLNYVIGADYYLRPVCTDADTTRYELLALADPDSRAARPHHTGHATIAPAHDDASVTSTYYAAVAAQRWIADHHLKWEHGSDTDPGSRYPLAVLTAAQAEGRCWFTAGALWREAAQLAGVELAAAPDQHLLETLRHNAIAQAGADLSAAQLASAVHAALPAHISAAHASALTWWYVLLSWGITAS
ncbi:MAG: hypothetical protein K2X52_21685 [Mycobacteriaceae bacterium]|nr:hypothetical protein [Mycobacteriaceae bacterium]